MTKGCGELYCSVQCRDQHWLRGHKLLCVGPIPDDVAPSHPLVLYKMHAGETHLVSQSVSLHLPSAAEMDHEIMEHGVPII